VPPRCISRACRSRTGACARWPPIWPARPHDDNQVSSRRSARRRAVEPLGGPLAAGITPAMVWGLVDGLADGVVLTDGDGGTKKRI
jgi:hypothetical protein